MKPAGLFGSYRRVVLSECQFYRYWLEDAWADGRRLVVIALNPSTADGQRDDPTVRKIVGFAIRLQCVGFILGNLYGWRATEPRDLRTAIDPIGPENDRYLIDMLMQASVADWPVVFAWGQNARDEVRVEAVERLAAAACVTPQCWGRNTDGSPRHPLMLAYDTALEPY